MKTREEFIEFYSSIPEKEWCVGTVNDRYGKSCAVGLLGKKLYGERTYPTTFGVDKLTEEQRESFLKLGELLGAEYKDFYFDYENFVIAESVIFELNDSDEGGGPKERILNKLNGH